MALFVSRSTRAERDQQREARAIREDLAQTWRRFCEHVGLAHTVTVAAGQTIVVPRLVNVDIAGQHLALIVRLMPGQTAADFTEHADRMAHALGVHQVRVIPRPESWVRIELLACDPLAEEVTLDKPYRAPVGEVPVLIARDENGNDMAMPWTQAPHCCVQGATRSGKSVWCYSVLAQLVGLADVRIAGSDPSGLLLGRPYEGTRHQQWQATGSADVIAHRDLLVRLVADMDQRIATLPPRTDKLTEFSPDQPLVVAVLEEFAGLLRLASTIPAARGEAKLRDQLLALYARLVSEGHKAGYRLLLVTQRADATVVGGFERGQLGLRLSFRVDDDEALPMLHGSTARHLVAQHRHVPPGVALVQTPTQALTRARGPRLPDDSAEADYARYWDEIARTAPARLHPVAA